MKYHQIDANEAEEACMYAAINAFWEFLPDEMKDEAKKMYAEKSVYRHTYSSPRHYAYNQFDHALVNNPKFLVLQEAYRAYSDMVSHDPRWST